MSNKAKYKFVSKYSDKPPTTIKNIQLTLIGPIVDDRGEKIKEFLISLDSEICSFTLNPSEQETFLDLEKITRSGLTSRLSQYKNILLDITTLGLGEILIIILAAQKASIKKIDLVYAEPGSYTNSHYSMIESRDFKLTTNCKFTAIHGFAHQYQSNHHASHIFFLGFEPGRLQSALEQRGDFDSKKYQIQVIVGIPAFNIGWEQNSIIPHIDILKERGVHEHSISYSQANSVREAYLTLWHLYQQLGEDKAVFYVSPLGTKPQSVGAALFLLETKGEDPSTSLFYDHPERVSGRSSDIGTWHHISVEINL